MNSILGIIIVKMKNFIRHKTTLIIIFLLPLAFTYFVSFQTSDKTQKYTIVVVDRDDTSYTRRIINDIKSENIMVEQMEEGPAKRAIYNLDAEVAYVFPFGMENDIKNNRKVTIKNYYLKKSQVAPVVNSLVAEKINKIYIENNIAFVTTKLAKNAGDFGHVRRDIHKSIENISVTGIEEKDYNINLRDKDELVGSTQGSMGFTVFFVMFTLVFSIGSIVDDRLTGTWSRINITTARKTNILFGYMASSLIQGILQVAFLLFCGVYIFGVDWGRSLPGVILVLFSFMISIGSMSLTLAGIVKTTAQLNAIAPLVMISTSMLGGCYWPLDIVSKPFQFVGRLVPQGWAMQGLTDLVVKGKGFEAAIIPSSILLVMGGIFFMAGVRMNRLEIQ